VDHRVTPSESVIAQAEEYVRSHLPEAAKYSTEEIFLILLGRAARAAKLGNYGIAAMTIAQESGTQVACIGENTLISSCDPTGHAELNSLDQLGNWLRGDTGDPDLQTLLWETGLEVSASRHGLWRRPAPVVTPGLTLFATLEPCPMCTVAIINAGVEKVVVAIEDPAGGALVSSRLSRLGSVWLDLAKARGLKVELVSSRGRGISRHSISLVLQTLLRGVLEQTREPVDRLLLARGVLCRHDALEGP
jgi:tRNA(adenine34) deaminase